MTTDTTVRQAVSDARLEQEMEELLANRPQYTEYVHGTNSEIEVTQGRALTSTAAELTIYNRESGEPSQVNFDAIKARMRQRFPADYVNPQFAGQRVYEMEKANVPTPLRGKLACPLSYGGPDPEALEMGFGTGTRGCRKPAYFLTPLDVDDHVRKNHKRFYELRKQLREDKQKEADRDLQRQMLTAIAGQVQAPRINTVSVDSSSTPAHPNAELPYDANGVNAPMCEKCGGVIEGKDSFAKARHNKTCPAKDGA